MILFSSLLTLIWYIFLYYPIFIIENFDLRSGAIKNNVLFDIDSSDVLVHRYSGPEYQSSLSHLIKKGDTTSIIHVKEYVLVQKIVYRDRRFFVWYVVSPSPSKKYYDYLDNGFLKIH